MKKTLLVDTRCKELAQVFLADMPQWQLQPGDWMELARVIQAAVEDYLNAIEARAPAPEPGPDLSPGPE
jgi:hypothetical protein